MKQGDTVSSEFLLGHHLWGAGFKMISTSWALLGKENLWDWICKRSEGVSQLPSSHGEDTWSRALLLARGSALHERAIASCHWSLSWGNSEEAASPVGQHTGDFKCGTSCPHNCFGIASCPSPEIQMANGISGMCTLGDTSGLIGSWVWEQALPWVVGTSPGLS